MLIVYKRNIQHDHQGFAHSAFQRWVVVKQDHVGDARMMGAVEEIAGYPTHFKQLDLPGISTRWPNFEDISKKDVTTNILMIGA